MNDCRVGRFDSEGRTCDMINGVRIERDNDIYISSVFGKVLLFSC